MSVNMPTQFPNGKKLWKQNRQPFFISEEQYQLAILKLHFVLFSNPQYYKHTNAEE